LRNGLKMSSYGRQLFLDSEMTRIEKSGAVDYSDRIRLNGSLPSKMSAPERSSVTGILLFSDEACNLSIYRIASARSLSMPGEPIENSIWSAPGSRLCMSRIPLRFEISRNPFSLRNGRLTRFAPDPSYRNLGTSSMRV
jgi:hypothetical protein